MTQQEMTDALDAVFTDAASQFSALNPDRLAQLDGALGTARMAVGYLFTEVPYHPGS